MESARNTAAKMNTRFAPSPTGYLHKGHIWSAMQVAATAKSNNANIHLRMEDHDAFRCTKHFAEEIKKDLEWIGFKWQSESVQSERHHIYQKYFDMLKEKNLLYEFYKTENPKIMFKNPEGEDFAIKDALGQWTYQFAVVVDDFEEDIDLIVRGEDLKDSVEKQIALAKAIGREKMPVFFHHSLLYDEAGKKLSKRNSSQRICKEKGQSKVLSEILNYEVNGWEEAIFHVAHKACEFKNFLN